MRNVLSIKLKALLSAVLLLAVASVAHAAFYGTQVGWFPITGNNSVNASGALYALSSGNQALRVFRLGTDNNIWITGHKADGSWDGWYNLGGPFNAAPAAASWSDSDQIVVGRFTNNAFYYRKYVPGTYANVGGGWGSAWIALGGSFRSAPTVTGNGAGKFYICGIGNDSHVWCGTLNGSTFHGFSRFEAPMSGGNEVTAIHTPAVMALATNYIQLAMVGSNKHMYVKSLLGGNWTVWEDMGGQFIGSPAFAGWASDDYVLVGIGTNQQVYRKRFTGNNWEGTTWDLLAGGTLLSGSGLAAVSRDPFQYHVVGEGTNYGLFINTYTE